MKFDVIGLSYYGYWHGTLADFQANLNDVASRYGKPVVRGGDGLPLHGCDSDGLHENIIDLRAELVSGYPATVGRADRDGCGRGEHRARPSRTAAASASSTGRPPGPRCTGNGWDPTDASSGNGWENQALFGFDDRALSSMSWFGHR